MEVGIDLAADALEALLNQVKGEVTAALQPIDPTSMVRNVYGYYHENIGNDDYPYIMMQEVSEGLQWYALPNIAENTFRFNIYGLVTHDDPRMCVNLRRRFAAALKSALNRRHLGVTLPGGVDMGFTSPYPPVYNIDYNISQQGNPLVRGFMMSWQAEVYQSVPDYVGMAAATNKYETEGQ